jgi:DNA-binding NarL/FixJ family response regulator
MSTESSSVAPENRRDYSSDVTRLEPASDGTLIPIASERRQRSVIRGDAQVAGGVQDGATFYDVVILRFAQVLILALTVHDRDGKVVDALCEGASANRLKNILPAQLLEALREVVVDGAQMSPEVARRVVRLFREFRTPNHVAYHLTKQECELLKLLADGHHRKTAAHELGISVNTVSFHLKNIYDKLQVHSKTEAVAKALRERLIGG